MRVVEQAHPSIRIHLFGEFIVERLLPSPPSSIEAPRYERVRPEEWRSRGPAMALLKALLCRPRRRASRDALIETLWPPDEDYESEHAFDSAASILRKVMRTQQGESLLSKIRTGGVTIYALPNQQRLWVDADAFEQFIDQAMRAERAGEDALPLWEAASTLVNGAFLEDDLYSGWAQTRRHLLHAAYHRCVHRLVDLYLVRNMVDQAETLLQEVVLDDASDEDALCRLMVLLEQQGRYQEALHLYHRSVRVLDEDYHTRPSARTITLVERMRNEPMGMAYSEMLSQKERLPLTQEASVSQALLPPLARSNTVLPQFPSPLPASLLDRTTSRRQMLQELLGVAGAALLAPPYELLNPDAWERLSTAISRATYVDEGVLGDLETITKSYWRLRANTSSADLFNGVLGHFQTTVHLMRERPATSAYERLCSLAGEIAQMIGQMLFDMQDYATAWTYYKFSLHAAQEAANEDLRAVGLGRLSFLVADGGHVSKAILLLQEAQHGASRNAIIRCWLAALEAEGQARLRNATACMKALDLAEKITAHQTLGGDRYATGFNLSRLAGYKGACFVRLHQPTEALAALREALALLNPQAIRRTSTLLTDMATAHVQQNEIEEACRLAHQALSMTIQTRSMSVLQRLGRLRRNLEPWKTLPAVKDIDEQLNTTLAMITS